MRERPSTETWIYAGRRASRARVTHAWVTVRDDREVIFDKKVTGTVIGGPYDVAVTREDGRITVHGRPAFPREDPFELEVLQLATPDAIERWTAEDRAAYQMVEGRKAKRAAANSAELNDALEVLRRYHARLLLREAGGVPGVGRR